MEDVIVIFIFTDVMPKVVADGVASQFLYLWQMESHNGRCCNHLIG